MNIYNTRSNIEPKNVYKVGNYWRISYDVKEEQIEFNEETRTEYSYIEIEVDKYPVDPVSIIKEYIDKCTNNKIINECSYNGTPVYLSIERQYNIQSLFLKSQIETLTYPITFNVGNGESVVFNSFDEIKEFYLTILSWIETCINRGREIKNSL